MARTVNYPKRAEKIKEMIDDLVKEWAIHHVFPLRKTNLDSSILTLIMLTL